MKLTGRQDIEAPLAFVHRALTDFDGWERAALRRGADVTRTDTRAAPGPGMGWHVQFDYRGKRRGLTLQLDQMEQHAVGLSGFGANLEGDASIDLLEMGARRTRLHVALNVKPRTLAARLFLQSLRLAKGKVTRRLNARLAQIAADIEDRYRRVK